MEEIINQLLSTLLNSKNINELPISNAPPTNGKFVFYNPVTARAESVFISQVAVNPTSGKQVFTATSNQTQFNLITSPTDVVVFKGRTVLIETLDYTYVNGVITLTSGAIIGEIITALNV